MSLLNDLFGGGKSPMGAANNYLNQIPGVAHQGYDSYINDGKDAGARTKSMYEGLMNDPTAFINKLMEGYKESEGYKYQKDQLTKDMSNTAAAGGVAGTPMDQVNQAGQIQGLLGKDMQQFLGNVLGVFNTGLQGEQGVADRGYDATGRLTDTLGNALNQQGGLAFQDQQQKNQNRNQLWSMFGNALGAGIGGFTGGVPGAKVGARIFG